MSEKMIRVTAGLHVRLEMAKGSKSYAEYIEAMLNYFTILNINPYSMQTHPALIIKDDFEKVERKIERSIAIMKAHEKEYFKIMLETIKNGSSLNNTNTPHRTEDNEDYVGSDLTVEELQTLVDENRLLREDKTRLEDENKRLFSDRDQWKQKAETSGGSINATIIQQCVEALEGKAQTNRLAEGYVQIPKDEFFSTLRRIKDGCK